MCRIGGGGLSSLFLERAQPSPGMWFTWMRPSLAREMCGLWEAFWVWGQGQVEGLSCIGYERFRTNSGVGGV